MASVTTEGWTCYLGQISPFQGWLAGSRCLDLLSAVICSEDKRAGCVQAGGKGYISEAFLL